MSKKIKIKKVENVYFYSYYAFICQNKKLQYIEVHKSIGCILDSDISVVY